MSARTVIPHCAWAMKETHKRRLRPELSWLIVTIAERVDRNTLAWWSSLDAIMADTRFSRRTIQRLIHELPPDLISARRGVNKRWVFTLLRPAVETPDAEVAEILEGASVTPSDPEKGASATPYPLKEESPEEKEEGAAHTRDPAPQSSPSVAIVGKGKEGRRIEKGKGRSADRAARYGERIAKHWSPSQQTYDYLADAGIEAVDRRADVFLHRHLASDWRQLDWDEAFVADCLGTMLPSAGKPAKPDRMLQVVAGWTAVRGISA